jgi:menaquinone-dependent protoporphyrinogen oxidase
MTQKVLVTYASWAGSTREVAESIGADLKGQGLDVAVLPVGEVKTLEGYQAVILGSAARIGQLNGGAKRFVNRFKKALAGLPTAYFVVCMTMSEDTAANRQTVSAYLNPLKAVKEPLAEGLFGGVMDPAKLGFPWGALMKNQVTKDARDWNAIHAWAEGLRTIL